MLLDTSGLFCLLNKREPDHDRAVAEYATATSRRITHSGILEELVPLCTTRKSSRELAMAYLLELLEDPRVDVIWIDEPLLRRALALLGARPDKAYSLCDAVSFILMKDRHLTDALTTDKHFEQEGFRRLLG